MQGITLRICAIAALLALLAGCVTPQRGTPRIQSAYPKSHWQFVPGDAADSDGYQPPAQLAVLLPLTGALAAAAAPVRDGLITGYYAESRIRPRLHFYDTRSTPEGAREALARAVADGAGQVVGPLGREEVAAVFASALPVPTLALNRAPGSSPPDNAGSYSLAPEDEGAAAAQYLLARQARRVVVISNGEDAATRSIDALRAGLLTGGGEVVETIALGNSVNTAGARLAAVIGEADAVFLAVRGAQARLLAPRLTKTRIGERPKVATSQLVQGTGKAQEDRALDGIVFPGTPWPTAPASWPLPASAPDQALPTARGAAARLFAFGVDAWSMSARLAYLAQRPDAEVSGATGTLRIGPDGTVFRTPAWLTFRRGVLAVEE